MSQASTLPDSLPPVHPDVARVLGDVFGDRISPGEGESLSIMKGGRSGATLASLALDGRRYVVRRPDPNRMMHALRAEHERICMMHASDLGIGPKVHHIDRETHIAIMDHIDGAPFGRASASSPAAIERLARALRTLHEGPEFPLGIDPMGAVAHFDQAARDGGAEGLPAFLVTTLAELAHVTRRFARSAPCHNDLNPMNILETPERVYFVDWETACASDPFFDLAELGVFAVANEDARAALLEAYLMRSPSQEERARSTLARVMALGFYAAAFFQAHATGGGAMATLPAPLAFPALLARMGDVEQPFDSGLVAASLLEAMRADASTDAYEEAKRSL